jgi:hypothetical protein
MDNFLEMDEIDYIKVESEVYQKEQENIKYYETAISLIEEILESPRDAKEDLEEIKTIVEDLRDEL